MNMITEMIIMIGILAIIIPLMIGGCIGVWLNLHGLFFYLITIIVAVIIWAIIGLWFYL